MNQILSACGLLCDQCDFLNNNCKGCHKVKGSTFWAKEMIPDKICPLYKCSVIEKKYKNCGQCAELPCNQFAELKDPNISMKEHKKSIKERVNRLI